MAKRKNIITAPVGMFRYIEEEKITILQVPELTAFRLQSGEYKRSKSAYKRKKLLKAIDSFFSWYLRYCEEQLKGKKYPGKLLAECVFREKFETPLQWKDYIIKSLYLSVEYVRYLEEAITSRNLDNFLHVLTEVEIDIEWLIAECEVNIRQSVKTISPNSWRRKNLSPGDIYWAAKAMFHIEEAKGISDLYLRDIKPVVMFQIRQLLELYGRNILGYYMIRDKHGNPSKKFTQVAWTFIELEIKKAHSRIGFPFHVHNILAVNSWANSYVHTTYLYSSYIQHFALKLISALFVPAGQHILTADGIKRKKFDHAEILVTQYDSLKKDFENHLNASLPGNTVEWMQIGNVGAYVISK